MFFPFSIPRLSSALKTMVNPANHETLNCVSMMFAWCETIFVFGLNFNADSLATYMHTQSVVIASSNVYVDVNSRELWTVWRGAFEIGIGDWDWSYQSCLDRSTAKSVRSLNSLHILCAGLKQTTSMEGNPDMTRFFRSSQPMPPAPTSSTRLEVTFLYSDSPRIFALYCSRVMARMLKKGKRPENWKSWGGLSTS